MSKLPKSNRPVLCIEDDENKSMLRCVDHGGVIYIETTGVVGGRQVSVITAVDRLRFIPAVLGWFS